MYRHGGNVFSLAKFSCLPSQSPEDRDALAFPGLMQVSNETGR